MTKREAVVWRFVVPAQGRDHIDGRLRFGFRTSNGVGWCRDAQRCRAPHTAVIPRPCAQLRTSGPGDQYAATSRFHHQRSECWVARSSRAIDAMGIKDTTPRSRDMMRPSSASVILPKNEGAGKTGCALHPRSRVQRLRKRAHTSIQVQRKQSGLPCAMVLTVSFVLFLVTGFLSPSPRKKLASQKLDASIGASGPHDFAVRLTRCSSKAHRRPPHPIPTFVTMANAPS